MKILVLSDLHLHFWYSYSAMEHYKHVMQNLLSKVQYDCIVISGDIFESDIMKSKNNPYQMLHEIFNNTCPIICTLGNHEFAYKAVQSVLDYYNSFQDRYNIHYLDVENKFLFNDINFVGNVFWYDNTLANNTFAIPDKIVSSWLDSTIRYFIPSKVNARCKQQILDNLDSAHQNILVTHTVPHYKLNWFSINEPNSLYNQYSGCKDFLKELKNVSWSISGHTHKRVMETIYNINCVNVGNDYLDEHDTIQYYVIDTEQK